MKAVVGVRSAPHRVDPASDGIETHRWGDNLPDRVAVEAALRVAEEVIAIGIGDDRARRAVRSALRMGVDEGVHIAYDPVEEPIGAKYARVLGRAAGRERPDAVFIGMSSPVMGPEVAGLVGETLGWPSISQVTAIGADAIASADDVDAEVSDGTADGDVFLQRKLGAETQEIVACEPPLVVGVDGAFANPRRAPLADVIAGQRASIRKVDLTDIAPAESEFSMSVGAAMIVAMTANERWGRGRPPREGRVEDRIREMLGRSGGTAEDSTELIEDVPPEDAAERIVDYLRTHDLL